MIESNVVGGVPTKGGVGEYLRIAARRKFTIALPTIGMLAITYAVVFTMPKQYSAEAVLAIDSRKVQVVEMDQVVSRLPQENAVLRTELNSLTSRSTAEWVVEHLGLLDDPEFQREIDAPRSLLQRFAAMLPGGMMRAERAEATDADSRSRVSPVSTAVDWLLAGLGVSNDSRSFTIHVTFVSSSPELSARVANAFADAYLSGQIEMKAKAARDASDWLRRRLDQMRGELEASEVAVQVFRREAGLLEVTKGSTMSGQQLSDLNAQLAVTRGERSRLEARLQIARDLASHGAPADAFPEIVAAPSVQALRQQLAAVKTKLDEQIDRGALRHPATIALQSQADSLNRLLAHELEGEMKRVVKNLDNEVLAARRRESNLVSSVRTVEGQYGGNSEDVVRLNQLQREAEANRTIYENFLNRYKQTMEQETLATADARLLSRAVPPELPYGPKRLPFLVFGLAGGAAVGMGLALLRERLDRSIRRTSEVEDLTGISVFGLLPKLSEKNAAPEEHVLSEPRSPFTEALRRVYVTFHLSHKALGAKAIMVTSAAAGEGKTSFCVSLARSLAASGTRVLVIDADLHRSRVASAFGCEGHAHLGDVVRGFVNLGAAVRIDARSSAHFLAAIPEEGDTQLLLNSMGFEALVARARAEYDLVVVDTPPILAATDAAAVGTITDANLLLVRWGSTPRMALAAALRFLNLCGVVVDGIVMAQVDARNHAHYGDICYSPLHDKALARVLAAAPETLPRVRSRIGERMGDARRGKSESVPLTGIQEAI